MIYLNYVPFIHSLNDIKEKTLYEMDFRSLPTFDRYIRSTEYGMPMQIESCYYYQSGE